MQSFILLLSLCLLAVLDGASAAPVLEARQSTTTLTSAQVNAYKPYTYYAGSAYCKPANTLAWNCGTNCNANSGFKPIASGGDGAVTQFWYVGWDPALATVIVGYQGTDPGKILPLITDANFFLKSLSTSLFPGVSSGVKAHDGFADAHARSANAVLSAVRTTFSRYSTSRVTVVGHSLGGALASIASLHIKTNIPSATVRTITFGMPRVGNDAFVSLLNSQATMNRINNQDDLVPIVPGRFLGFSHTEGEIHILDNNSWVSCPGTDNTNAQCTIGYVPNLLSGDAGDHSGPFNGIKIGC
ncbi:lipase [Coprinopsis sp. MPI-PUGE-AT-0042]|nr:lipase [Coprinopsis sp. MPI-PUGE-AT-0042]